MSNLPCIILDNGAGRIKFGVSGHDAPMGSVPNCTATVNKQMQKLVGSEVDKFSNGSLLSYSRPFDRGYVVNWGVEIEIWRHVFSKEHMNLDVAGRSLVLTEAPFTPDPIRQDMDEIVFEEFHFDQYLRRPASWFSSYEFSKNPPAGSLHPQCSVVLDSGFSFSYITPFVNGNAIPHACKRVNVGGKLLTNYLKEIISYRQWNMMDEFKLMDQVKEELCYVSEQFDEDLRYITECNNTVNIGGEGPLRKKSNIKKYFVLPDFHTISRGFVKPEGVPLQQGEQVLAMESERFSVPEVLFHPSDIGMEQAGVAEAMSQGVKELTDLELHLVANNIVLTGGNTMFPNFRNRFFTELRPLMPDDVPINVYIPDDPINYAWRGASNFAKSAMSDGTFRQQAVTRAEYLEFGSEICRRKFTQSY